MEVERALNLVHTTEFLQRAKDAMGALPPGARDYFSYDDFDDNADGGEGGDEGPSTPGSRLSWLFSTTSSMGDFNLVILREYQKAANDFRQHLLQENSFSLSSWLVFSYKNVNFFNIELR